MEQLFDSIIILLSDILFWPVLIFIGLCIAGVVLGENKKD